MAAAFRGADRQNRELGPPAPSGAPRWRAYAAVASWPRDSRRVLVTDNLAREAFSSAASSDPPAGGRGEPVFTGSPFRPGKPNEGGPKADGPTSCATLQFNKDGEAVRPDGS